MSGEDRLKMANGLKTDSSFCLIECVTFIEFQVDKNMVLYGIYNFPSNDNLTSGHYENQSLKKQFDIIRYNRIYKN